jgi:hypothetical protein
MMNKPLRTPVGLTDSQLSQVQSAAALLRVESRSQFLHAVAAQLLRLRNMPTNADVNRAIQVVLGVVPIEQIMEQSNATAQTAQTE